MDRLDKVVGLDHTSKELIEEFSNRSSRTPSLYHTGGGCMVLRFREGRGRGFWLTRDGEDTWFLGSWLLGYYDFGHNGDVDDEGYFVTLPIIQELMDYPYFVAAYACLVMREIRAEKRI